MIPTSRACCRRRRGWLAQSSKLAGPARQATPSTFGSAAPAQIASDPPVPNLNYAAPMYVHPSWVAPTFGGGTFGLTLDSYGNIYVAATSIYSGVTSTPGAIYKVDKDTAEVSVFAELPNNGPAIGNLNYDCVSETIRATGHEDGRIY